MEDGDSRNNKGKGVGKHSYNAKEQKRIQDIKLKKETQREETLLREKNKGKEENTKKSDDEPKVDPMFGQRMSRKMKNQMKDNDEYDF